MGAFVRLDVSCADAPHTRVVNLWSLWSQLPVFKDDYINAIGSFSSPEGGLVVLDVTLNENAVIIHPDILVAVTAITDSMTCARRSIVRSLVRFSPTPIADGLSDASYGTLLHSVVQECMDACTRGDANVWTATTVRGHILRHLSTAEGQEACFRSGDTQESLEKEVMSRLSCLHGFGSTYFGPVPKRDAWVAVVDAQRNTYRLSITGVRDTERDVQSVALGLRGRTDVLVDVAVNTNVSILSGPVISQERVSLELKTGAARHDKPYSSDCAQTLLYSMILSEETDRPLQAGLLLYTRTGKLWLVPEGRNEVRDLLCQRNEVALWLARKEAVSRHVTNWTESALPAPIDDAVCCSKCRVVDSCMLFNKVSGCYDPPSSDMEELYTRKTKHLRTTYANFLDHWSKILLLEEACGSYTCMPSWIFCADVDVNNSPPDGPLRVRFRLEYGDLFPSGDCVTQGDAVLVSLVSSPLAIVRASVLSRSASAIEVQVSHFYGSGSELVDWRVFNSMNRFRLSRDTAQISHCVARGNLIRLFGANTLDLARRKFLVDLRAPRFRSISLVRASSPLRFLNIPQRAAVDLVLSARDYALIRGMPGTGKTTLIVSLIGELVRRGKSVLITGHTHSAVDNVLSKLTDADYDIVRFGKRVKIHPSVHKFSLCDDASAAETLAFSLKALTAPVVATTCLSLNHAALSRRIFDYSIVDEASQVTVPASLGPLRLCRVLVLVGDDQQLPPLVRSEEARSQGLGISMFQMLFERHPQACVDLTVQYRMASNIMSICNELTYKSRMVSGSEETSSRRYRLCRPDRLTPEARSDWIADILQDNLTAVFIDTDGVPGTESAEGSCVWNDVEATLVASLVSSILARGGQQDDIGVITPYRRQLESLSNTMSMPFPGVELLTIDMSQGREKECVIVSLVRSNDRQEVGLLLGDPRRLNVAFSRARSKLIVLGSRRTLHASPYMSQFMEYMDVCGWTRHLSPASIEI